MNEFTCPKCLGSLSDGAKICPATACGYQLPENYFQCCREAPPLPIAAVGYSGHGKTHLLAALVLAIRNLTVHPMGEDVTLEVLDDQTRAKLQEWIEKAEKTQILPETRFEPNERPEPMILRISGIFPPRTLLIYDVPGQIFHDMTRAHECLPVLREIQTVWFVLSPHNLKRRPSPREESSGEKPSRDLSFLFSAYKTAMNKLGARLDGRNAVIVVSKGDKVGDEAPELRDYLMADPLQADVLEPDVHFSLKTYEEEVRRISGHIRHYVGNIRDVLNVVGLLRKERMEVSFCVTSALGKDPVEGMYLGQAKTDAPWARQRVLDPLIWTFLLEKERQTAKVLLIVDPYLPAGAGFPKCGDSTVPHLLWGQLKQLQRVQTTFLGKSAPAVGFGQALPKEPPRSRRLRLIGPLLDPLLKSQTAQGSVVLVTNNLVADIDDFRDTTWTENLLLVTTSDRPEVREQWPFTKVIEIPADLAEVAEFVNRTL